MIIKHAQHFLTAEGKKFFKEWVKTLQAIAKKYSGFDAVWPMYAGEQSDEIHLLMVFADEMAYQKWVSGEEHTRVLDELAGYRLKQWQAKTYVSIERCME